MKNVLIVLILLSGWAVSEASAQACKPADCKPCPPGCCIINCCAPASAAGLISEKALEATFVSFMTEGENSTANTQEMSRKEIKSCMKACKVAYVKANPTGCKPSPTCQPSPACNSSAAAVFPVGQSASVNSKN